MRRKTFTGGGVHPPEYKELTEHLALEAMPIPEQLAVPLSQCLGRPAKPLVKKGSEVKTGTLIAEADGYISVAVHSPVTGRVTGIGREHSGNGSLQDVVLIQPSESQERDYLPPIEPESASAGELIERIRQAGIVGQGGAAFPTYVKISPPRDKKIDSLVINACECEPYLTRDYRLMLDRTFDLISGVRILMKILGLRKSSIGIEDNKPEAIRKLRETAGTDGDLEIIPLKTKYPQGGEKMLLKAVLDREVPQGKLPMDVGAVVQNTGTAVAVHDAVVNGEPAIKAVLTVSGRGIRKPRNLVVPVGTAIRDVIRFCGGIHETAARILVGGPMMGTAQHSARTPVVKATSGILVLTKEEISWGRETACLKCGRCVSACALNLMPTRLARLSRLGRFEEAGKLNITTCMECGTCAYECPAHIPLVQWIRLGKQAVLRMQRNRN
ncbi:MAG: electron transport complex subunit RsxC [Acidobacteria bacterium]|nr:electron transport complex subunit RsxC [Acidobacteriota bacterium]